MVPELLTEEGIKHNLECDLGFLSRLLNENEKKGYIFRKKVKIKNKKRRQNGFFLTQKGLQLSREINKLTTN
jgi:predicted transcriptional regulator